MSSRSPASKVSVGLMSSLLLAFSCGGKATSAADGPASGGHSDVGGSAGVISGVPASGGGASGGGQAGTSSNGLGSDGGSSDCAQGQINYQKFAQALIGSNDSCKTDSDCALGYEGNACNDDCGFSINASAAASVESALKEYASNHCSTCPPEILPPCIPLLVACVEGACTDQ